MGLVQELQKAVQNSTTTAHERGAQVPSEDNFDTYADFLEPDELYTLAKTEYKAWVRFVILVEEKLLVNDDCWETMRERWFSD